MRPDSRSVSFTFHRDTFGDMENQEVDDSRGIRNLRQRLQDKFDKEKSQDKSKDKVPKERDGNDRSWTNLSFANVSVDSRKALRSGAEKISKTISSVRTTFGTISQVCKAICL